MKTVDEIILENIMRQMTNKDLNQRQLAKKADIDVVTLNRIFTGKRGAGKNVLSRLAKAMDCSVDELMRPAGEDSRAPAVTGSSDLTLEIIRRLLSQPALDEDELRGLLTRIETSPSRRSSNAKSPAK